MLLGLYCAIVLLASLAGGWVLLSIRLTHTRMQVATSFVAGLMLGVGVLHIVCAHLDAAPTHHTL